MASGVRGVKSRPTVPRSCLLRREVLGAGSSSGVVPSALAITFVLPKKSLVGGVVSWRVWLGEVGWGSPGGRVDVPAVG